MKKVISVIAAVLAITAMLCVGASAADIVLPDIISDHMLLQQGEVIRLWGSAGAGETVNVKITANGEACAQTSVKADAEGNFTAELPPMNPGGPYELVFTTAASSVTVKDVLLGELWIQCGQSNMVMPVRNCIPYAQDMLPDETINDIRLFYNTTDDRVKERSTNLEGEWKIADREAVEYYSAIGFCALNVVYNELQIPVGGICNAVSGASMKSFTGPETAGEAGGTRYNSKLAPLSMLNVRGVMWNQGSADRTRTADDFASTFTKLIETWRSDRNEPDMPFVYVSQPPSLMKYYASWEKDYIMQDWSDVRLGHIQTYYDTDNTAFIVTTDRRPEETDKDPLHPYNKQTVGERLGNAVLGSVYGRIENWQSPLYKISKKNGKSVDITFSNVYDGLKTTDGEKPGCFLVAQTEGDFHAADAEIINENTIRLSCSTMTDINYISYCVEKHLYPYTSVEDAVIDTYPDVNVVNSENLPLASFYVKVGEEREEKVFDNFAVISERIDVTAENNNDSEGVRVNPFTDITAEDLFYEDVINVYYKCLMNGVGENKFNPDGELSKAMLLTVLYRIDDNTPKGQSGENWYTLPALWAKEKGLCDDISDGALSKPLTNGEMAQILYMYLQPEKAEEAVNPTEWLIRNFIIEAEPDENATLTRAQAASAFERVSE